MPRISRVVLPGFAHHVTQRGVRRGDVFFEDGDRALYLRHLKEQAQLHEVKILCYCLMTNHVHLLAVPSTGDALARAVGEAHRRYTLHLNRRIQATGYLFQGRFSSCPCDEEHLSAAARYVLLNPVRSHQVERAVDYRWSSAAFHVGLKASDPLVESNDLMGLLPSARAWGQLMKDESPLSEEREQMLRRLTRTGRPCGKGDFVEQASAICGRSLTPKKPGPIAKSQNGDVN